MARETREVQDVMDAFRSAAARRGAYAEQCQAAEAALQLLELVPADTLLLEELQEELQRLLTNVASCIKRRRLDARGPQKVVQKRLGLAKSRTVRRLREARTASSPLHALAPKPATPAIAAPAVAAHCPLLATLGPRHLCESYCYFREHEPTRRLHALRLQLAAHGVPAEAAADWRVEPRLRTPRPKRARRGQGEGEGGGDGGGEGGGGAGREVAAATEWRVVFVSGVGTEYATQTAALRAAVAAAAAARASAAAASCASPAGGAGGAARGGSASSSPAAACALCAACASPSCASVPASARSSALAWSPLAQRSRFFRAPPPAALPTTAAPPTGAPWRPPRSPRSSMDNTRSDLAHAATHRSRGPPACTGQPSWPEKEHPRRVDAEEGLLYRVRSGTCPESPMPPPFGTL